MYLADLSRTSQVHVPICALSSWPSSSLPAFSRRGNRICAVKEAKKTKAAKR